MSYKITPEADEDYYAIYRYGVEQFGGAQAEAYADRLDQGFDFVADNPGCARLRHELHPPVRAWPVGAHLIVYQVEADGSVTILRIPHARSDWVND